MTHETRAEALKAGRKAREQLPEPSKWRLFVEDHERGVRFSWRLKRGPVSVFPDEHRTPYIYADHDHASLCEFAKSAGAAYRKLLRGIRRNAKGWLQDYFALGGDMEDLL